MPEPASLAFAFGLPPEQAVEYLRRKGYAISWDWRGVWQAAQAKAFTVAKAMRVDILQDIRGAVDRAIAQGETFETFQRQLAPLLKAKGWWGRQIVVDPQGVARVAQLGSPWRLRTIYETNLQTAYMAGRYAAFKANESDRPYWEYVAVMDGRTRPAHAALNGKIFRSDDAFWRHFYPPNGFRCRCRVRSHSAADIEARGLKVSNSNRYLKEDTLVDRDGLVYPSAVLKLPGMAQGVRPDQGWAYNPGAASAKPFTPPPLDEAPVAIALPQTLRAGEAPPALPTPKAVGASELYPAILTEREVAERFLAEFGASLEKSVVFRDVMGEPLQIGADLVTAADGLIKAAKRGRGPFMGLVAQAIQAPDEIWLRWEELRRSPGEWRLRRRYIRAYELADGHFGLGVFEEGQDGWRGVTAFAPDPAIGYDARLAYINQYRGGFLLYRKG
jgi:SPP1 gp7 family putative phage head morphogenesis protein